MQIIQLIDHDGKTILFEAFIGRGEGEWNILNEDEASMLISELQNQVDYEV